MNSGMPGTTPAPFGYLKAASNLQSVNLFVMPYNYPVLLPLLEEWKQDPRARTSQSWKLRLDKYLATVPCYYIQVCYLLHSKVVTMLCRSGRCNG